MSSIMRARSGLTGRSEEWEIIAGSSLKPKVAGPSMLGIGCPGSHALLLTPPKNAQTVTRAPPARAGSFLGHQPTTAPTALNGSFGVDTVVNALATGATYDPDPMQFLGIRLPVTFDTCEVIEERWANWMRQDPVVAIETEADNFRRLKALYIDCGEKSQFNLLYDARRFVRRLNELGIAHRYGEFPDNHTGVDYGMDEGLPFLAQALPG
jgi:hypothetical protein